MTGKEQMIIIALTFGTNQSQKLPHWEHTSYPIIFTLPFKDQYTVQSYMHSTPPTSLEHARIIEHSGSWGGWNRKNVCSQQCTYAYKSKEAGIFGPWIKKKPNTTIYMRKNNLTNWSLLAIPDYSLWKFNKVIYLLCAQGSLVWSVIKRQICRSFYRINHRKRVFNIYLCKHQFSP